jgi:molecular chaperone GrpE
MAEEKEQKGHTEDNPEANNHENVQQEDATTAENTDNSAEKASPADEIAALNDKYLRLYSEFDNFRKRTNKEKLDLISTASSSVLKDLIVVLDDFDRAIANNGNTDDVEVLRSGFQLIHTKLRSILESKGLKAMSAKGEAFDAELHEAIANVPAPSDDLKGKVIDDVEKGYYLNDKVLRYAKVVVGQ